MRSQAILFFLIFLVIFVAIDLYVYKGLKHVGSGSEILNWQKWLPWVYWGISGLMYFGVLAMMLGGRSFSDPSNYKYFYGFFGFMILFFVPKLVFSVFHLAEDLIRAGNWMVNKMSPTLEGLEGTGISRMKFISQTGLALAAIPFTGILYGMIQGRFNWRVFSHTLAFERLPKAFDGLKIVQISDIHIGSFFDNHKPVEKVIEKINSLEPDLIFFTGDLVNNYAKETEGWVPVFQKLKAKMGKYSILGNHDYGDYGQHASDEAKVANFEGVKQANRDMGFNLLLDESVKIEKDGESFDLIGVENWGVGFHQMGDLNKAIEKVDPDAFKILLSHDPSHWDAQVKETDIELTLSGHTHGMQFGVEIGSFKWSPVKYRYPRWAGLYSEGEQYIHVNRGFGYIGFPGRVGINPEITLIELQSKA
jgi:predicted MPP superfamily phosphohydrolase